MAVGTLSAIGGRHLLADLWVDDAEALRRAETWAAWLPEACRGAGAIVLAAVAALRAGAGKVAIATAESIAPAVSVAVPEARVIGLPQTPAGGLAPAGIDRLGKLVERLDAGFDEVLRPAVTSYGTTYPMPDGPLKDVMDRLEAWKDISGGEDQRLAACVRPLVLAAHPR